MYFFTSEGLCITSHFLISFTISQFLHSSFIKYLAKKYTVGVSVQLDLASMKIIAGSLSWIMETFSVNIELYIKNIHSERFC